MRRRARNMRDAARLQPRDMIGERLVRARQHHRTAADDGAQEYLKAAIAADVIEGRPDRSGAARRAVGDDRAGQRLQGMADDLRHARGARGQHQPFGRALGLDLRCGARRRPGRHHQLHVGIGPSLRMVGDHGIDVGVLDQALQMIGVEIGRTQQHAPRDAIDLRHRQGRRSTDRTPPAAPSAPRVRASRSAEAGVFENVGQRDNPSRIRDRAALQAWAEIIAEREGFTRGHFHRPR